MACNTSDQLLGGSRARAGVVTIAPRETVGGCGQCTKTRAPELVIRGFCMLGDVGRCFGCLGDVDGI